MRSMTLAMLISSCATPMAMLRTNQANQASTQAAVAMARGEYVEALAIADHGLSLYPDDAWLLYNRGAALAGLARVDDALVALLRAEDSFAGPRERALAIYNGALPLDLERGLTTYRRALALEFVGRCTEAAALFARYAMLTRQVEDSTFANETAFHLRSCYAPTAQQAAERELIARLQRTASDEHVKAAQRASTAAVEAMIDGDYTLALDQAESGLRAEPRDPWLLYNRGTALAGLGRVDDAVAVLREAEELFPEQDIHARSVAIYRRAVVLEMVGRCGEAIPELQRYAKLIAPSEPTLAQRSVEHIKHCHARITAAF